MMQVRRCIPVHSIGGGRDRIFASAIALSMPESERVSFCQPFVMSAVGAESREGDADLPILGELCRDYFEGR